MQNQSMLDTAELLQSPLRRGGNAQTISSSVEVDLAGLSDQGKVRKNNQDTFFIARFDRSMQALGSNLPNNEYPATCTETSYGMLVADGMGGHAAGEVASRTAVLVLLDLVLKTPDWIMRLDDQVLVEMMHRTEQRLQEIQVVLAEQAHVDANLTGMGTTLTLAWSLGADLIVAHVGDSRAYLCRQSQLQQLTRDQTVAQNLVDAGRLTDEEGARHRLRHVLTGVLSTAGGDVPLEFRHFRLENDDTILLCSDGLTEMVPESVLADMLRGPVSSKDACRALVDLALEAGGRDNITAVVARYRLPNPT